MQAGSYTGTSTPTSGSSGDLVSDTVSVDDSEHTSNGAIVLRVALLAFIVLLLSRWIYVRCRARRAAASIGGGDVNGYYELNGNRVSDAADPELEAAFAADAEHHRSFWHRNIAEPSAPDL